MGHQFLGAARQIQQRPARNVHRGQEPIAGTVGDSSLERLTRRESDRVHENVETSPSRCDRLEQCIYLRRVANFQRKQQRCLYRCGQRLDIGSSFVIEISHCDLGACPMHLLGASPGNRSIIGNADDQRLLFVEDGGVWLPRGCLRHVRALTHLIAAAALLRLASATRLATAQDARRVMTLSARLVRMIGTRAPSTMPAAAARARKERLLASMLPASRSGTTNTLARPATGETMCLIAAASSLIALSSASGPSRIPPVI